MNDFYLAPEQELDFSDDVQYDSEGYAYTSNEGEAYRYTDTLVIDHDDD